MQQGTKSKHSELFDIDAERSILGSCMLHSAATPDVAAILRADDFYTIRHQRIFDAIVECHRLHQVTDPLVVGNNLRQHDRLEEAGGHDYLIDLLECVVSAAGVEMHAEIVREHAQRRGLRDLADGLAQRVAKGEHPAEIAAAAELQLEALGNRGGRAGLSPCAIINGWKTDGPLIHVPTGFATLDELTGGGPPFGARCYILGAPDAGKTAFAVQVADEFLEQGYLVGFLAIDEEPGDILMRFLQRRGFSRRMCEQRDPTTLESMAVAMAKAGLVLYDEDHSIESAARDLASRAKKMNRRAAFFIDSVQTARSENEIDGASMHAAVTARVRAVRAATSKHGFVAYVTSEMGRSFYRAIEGAERQSDMAAAKESGAIEYSARFMLTLRSVSGESDLIEARITKNKFGPRMAEGQTGIYLRLNRADQILIEDQSYVALTPGDLDQQRDRERSQRAIADAAVLALVILDEPGIAKTDAEDEFMRRAKCGSRRWKSAWSVLRRALHEVPASRNRLSIYLIGAKVPPEVLADVPMEHRAGVAASNPETELHRAAPSSTGDAGATERELHHHPLRSRGGAARECTPKENARATKSRGAAREAEEQ